MDSMTDAKKAQTKISVFEVKHASGGWSKVEFKSYDQKRGAYEGTERNIWFDEEPPEDIYAEGLTRTMTGDHMLMITFTPMEGMSNVIKTFTNGGDYSRGEKGPGKYVCNQTWDDVPHLSEESKRELLASYPEYQRKARSLGIPELGQGAVWPVDTTSFSIAPMEIPKHWNRVGAMDFGWKDPTAMLWAAIDPESDTWYIYSEHYFSEKPPLFHAEAIKTRSRAAGFDIPMVCDPSGGGLNPNDGRQMRLIYEKDYNIPLIPANNSIEPGISTVLERFNAGKIKVFNNLPNFFSEFRAYQRDKKGKPCGNDHLMDTLRYLIMSGFSHATNKAVYDAKHNGIVEVPWHDWDSELPWNYM
jgi:phage terminase large subunit-like protein